jgi:DNA-binding transcriptional MerR regulator
MSQYTTGEIAKLTGITVRTVQYYDSRGILMPSDFSEGGRRLYNDEDLKKLRVICFMRDLDISINSIAEILEAENSEKIISVMLEQKLALVEEELAEQEKRRDTLLTIQKEMKHYNNFSVDHLGDIAQQMKSKKQLRKIRAIMLAVGIPLEIIEVASDPTMLARRAFLARPTMKSLMPEVKSFRVSCLSTICS